MSRIPHCPACGKGWLSEDGCFAICTDCPYRIPPAVPAGSHQTRDSVVSGNCAVHVLIEQLFELTADLDALKAEREADAKTWAELYFKDLGGKDHA